MDIHTFPEQRTAEIRATLEKMQFADIDRILSKLEELEDPNEATVKACMFAEIPISDTSMADIFFVIREQTDGSLYVEAALAWVQIETIRTEEGFMDAQKGYLSSQGPLPTVEQIAQDIRLLVQYEKMVDFLFIKNNLDADLARIGFHQGAEILRSARQSGSITYLEATEQIGGDSPHATDSVHFEFIVMSGDTSGAAKLSIIKVFLQTYSPDAAAIKDQTQTAFYPLNSQFPQKETMIQEVLSQAMLDKNKYMAPVKSISSTGHSPNGTHRIGHQRRKRS
jgi:hypothetical protein